MENKIRKAFLMAFLGYVLGTMLLLFLIALLGNLLEAL